MSNISSAAFADTKPHYNLLDGLRGVAALMVMWYHIFEGFATSPIDQNFNHGYLAVDFFSYCRASLWDMPTMTAGTRLLP